MTLLARVAAVALVAAAATVSVPAAPASAAACTTDSGVTVVVDFKGLGGGVQSVCDTDGGGSTAASLFSGNGFALSYVQRQPGFVCRIDGVPADEACVNTPPEDAYWSLWWSDGTSGSWTYSTAGAGSLKIPDGGYVGFAWDASAGSVQPGLAAAAHATSEPTASPSNGGSGGRGGGGTGGGGGGGGQASGPVTSSPAPTASPSASPTAAGAGAEPGERGRPEKPGKPEKRDQPGKGRHGEPSASPDGASGSAAPTDEASDLAPSAEPPADGGDGLPGWVAPGLVALLFAGAGGTVLLRRRGSATP
ncbi:hypothetical protein [Nocardioides ferulae]|uniref:hypothetical protein n=1 Tax=Nocardioides ferulae TaxID=2340821 RepID=UPI0013DE3555|nr:hypothetical protein [Nocardioides ferulae]